MTDAPDGVWERRERRTAVGGSQKRLARCFFDYAKLRATKHNKNPKIAKKEFHFTRGHILSINRLSINRTIATSHRWKHAFHQKSLLFSQRILRGRIRKSCGKQNYVPVRGSTFLGPKKGKKGLRKKLWWILACSHHSPCNFDTSILFLPTPYSISKSFSYFGETTTRAYSTDRSLRDAPSP